MSRLFLVAGTLTYALVMAVDERVRELASVLAGAPLGKDARLLECGVQRARRCVLKDEVHPEILG